MSRLKNIYGSFLVVVSLLILYAQLPLGTAFEFSSDEGYEVIMPFLCNHGHILYKEIWDDQPPVSIVLIATAFKIFGTSILTARAVVAGFGILLFTLFHDLIRRRSGQLSALFATFLLLSSPGVVLLSVSAMQEVPTLATGLLAAWLLFQGAKQRHWAWLLSSGMVMAVAVQIKLTAVLLVPAMLLEFVLLSWTSKGKESWTALSVRNVLLWSAGAAAVLILIGLTWAKGSLEQSWKSHTGEQFVPGLDRVENHQLNLTLLQNHVECILAAVAGICLALSRKRGREIAFPVALLLTDSLVHVVHRPWWNYYYLHLAVPLTWLAGWAISVVIQDIVRLHAKYKFGFSPLAAWKQWALCILVAMVITRSELRLEWIIKDLRHHPSATANPIVQKMEEYAKSTHLVYSESGLYAFHAQLPVRPELAVITLKRFWSGQITTGQIVAICRRDKPEMIVLPEAKLTPEWKDFLDVEYENVARDDKSILFIARRIETRSGDWVPPLSPGTKSVKSNAQQTREQRSPPPFGFTPAMIVWHPS